MSEETTRNFWEVMRSFQWPEPKPISFRLYHDDAGRPVIYSMEELPGSYIEIDQATYTRGSHHVRVKDGRLIILEPKVWVSKLVPHAESGTACHPRDVCVIVDDSSPHQKWREITNDID